LLAPSPPSSSAHARTDFTAVKPNRQFTVETAQGVSLSAQEWGNPAGPTLVFIHGFLQSHLAWWKQVTDAALAARFRMITFDLPGHGASDKPWDAALYGDSAKWAATLAAVLDAAGPQKALVVGWSYGTRIIADYLLAYGDGRLAGINFAGSTLNDDAAMLGPGMKLLGGALVENLAQNLAATRVFNRSCFAEAPSDADLDQFTAISMAVPIKIRRWSRRPAPYEAALKAIKVPTLVTHGALDSICLLALGEYVARTVPNAQASYYDDVGHAPFWEDAARFNAELAAFAGKAFA
jgi:pimeloyl-ACP methyl ester carboxylesterase